MPLPSLVINIDLFVALAIITFYSNQRFDTWPEPSSDLLIGKPSDYINTKRFYIFFVIYVLSLSILALAFYGIPDLLQISAINHAMAAIGLPENSRTLSVFSLVAIAVVNIPFIAKYEVEWRRHLHTWARIPREVDDLKRGLLNADQFEPSDRYLELAQLEIKKAGMSLQPEFKALETGWLDYLERYQIERENNSIHWQFLRCLMLYCIAKDVCSARAYTPNKETEQKVIDLGSRLLSFNLKEDQSIIKDLNNLSDYYMECICKHVVKTFNTSEERVRALNNFGFNVAHQDSAEPHYGLALGYCIIGVGFCALLSVAALRVVLLKTGQISDFSLDRYLSWTLGNFLSLCVAIFVAAIISTRKHENDVIDTVTSIFICLFVATLASALYFIIVQDLSNRSTDNPFARVVLALSFAVLSPFVFRAISETSFSKEDVQSISLTHGLLLGCIMAITQCMVTIAFNIHNYQFASLADFIIEEQFKMLGLAAVGFGKGLFLGYFITYLIQTNKRGQFLRSLRSQPRANTVVPMRIVGGNEPVLTKDISRNGLKIETQKAFIAGDTIELESSSTGKLRGYVKWVQQQSKGRVLAGVYLIDDYPTLQGYLRESFGAYYA